MQSDMIAKKYKILEIAEESNQYKIFKVKEIYTSQIMALKLQNVKDGYQGLRFEFNTLSQLQNPYIVQAYDFGTTEEGIEYFTMEYIHGRPVCEFFNSKDEIDYPLFFQVALQICKALKFIHSQKAVHGDINPFNILLTLDAYSSTTPLVKLTNLRGVFPSLLREDRICEKSFPYIAPEVIKGEEPDYRADLYSFGVTLYFLLTSFQPFQIDSKGVQLGKWYSFIERKFSRQIPLVEELVPSIPVGLSLLISRLMEPEPLLRYQSADDILKAIMAISGIEKEKVEKESEDKISLSSEGSSSLEQTNEIKTNLKENQFKSLKDKLADLTAIYKSLNNGNPKDKESLENYVKICLEIGKILRQLGKLDEAMEYFKASRDSLQLAGNNEELAGVYYQIGSLYMFKGDYKEASESANKGQKLLGEKEHPYSVKLYQLLGNIAWYRGEFKDAIQYFKIALSYATKLNLKEGIANAYNGVATIFRMQGDYEKAIAYYQRSLDIYKQIEDISLIGKTYNNIGNAYYSKGEWEKATICWERYQEICKKTGELYEQVNCQNNLGCLYRDRGYLEQAIKIFGDALKIAKQIDYTRLEAMLLGNRGEAYLKLGEFEKSKRDYEEAMKIASRIGASDEWVETVCRMLELKMRSSYQNGIDEVIREGEEALQKARDMGLQVEKGNLYRILGHASFLKGDYSRGYYYLKKSLILLRESGSYYKRGITAYSLAYFNYINGNYRYGLYYIEEALKVFTKLGALIDQRKAILLKYTLKRCQMETPHSSDWPKIYLYGEKSLNGI